MPLRCAAWRRSRRRAIRRSMPCWPMGIGDIQRDMGEYVDADRTFADAVRMYAALGMPREEALARAANANVALRMGHLERAKGLLAQAEHVRGMHSSDHELNARLALV